MLEDSVGKLTATIHTECMRGDWSLSQIENFGSHVFYSRTSSLLLRSASREVVTCHKHSTVLIVSAERPLLSLSSNA